MGRCTMMDTLEKKARSSANGRLTVDSHWETVWVLYCNTFKPTTRHMSRSVRIIRHKNPAAHVLVLLLEIKNDTEKKTITIIIIT